MRRDFARHRPRRRQLQLRGGGAGAFAQGILPHTSSDIYCKNRIKGPAHSLAHVMSKFFAIGDDPGSRCSPASPHQAADALRLPGKGATRGGRRCRHHPVRVSCGPILFTDTGRPATRQR